VISANPGSGASYKKKLVDGRCKLHMVWTSFGTATPGGNVDADFPQLKFWSDSNDTNLVFNMTDIMAYDAGSGVYDYMYCLDLPPQGFLFEDGMWVTFGEDTYEISILVSGGSAS
jgi:hypothetical protein